MLFPRFCTQRVHCQWGPYGDWSECDGCTKLQVRRINWSINNLANLFLTHIILFEMKPTVVLTSALLCIDNYELNFKSIKCNTLYNDD